MLNKNQNIAFFEGKEKRYKKYKEYIYREKIKENGNKLKEKKREIKTKKQTSRLDWTGLDKTGKTKWALFKISAG